MSAPIVEYADPLDAKSSTPVTDPPSCSLWINGVRFADGQPGEDPLDPVALTDLRVTFGRPNAIDQPSPSTATFSVQDLAGGQTFLKLLKLGARVDVRADAVIYPDPSLPMLPDPGFAGGVGSRYATPGLGLSVAAGRLVVTPAPGVRYGTVYFPPAPLSGDPSAWNAVPRSRPGQTWRAGATVTTTSDLGTIVQTARLRAAYYRNPNGSGVQASPVLASASAATPGDNVLGPVDWIPDDDYWVGLSLEINPTGPAWNELDGRSWESLGAAPGATTVTNLISNPQPAAVGGWSSNNQTQWPTTYAAGEITAERTAAAATPDIAATVYRCGILEATANPTLPAGVKYQRSVEVWADAAAVVGPPPQGSQGGFIGGQAIPANTWTRVVQQFTGTGTPQYVTGLRIDIPGVGPGKHVKLRKAQLIANPSGTAQPYFDGSTPDTAITDYGWTGTAGASTSTAAPKPGPAWADLSIVRIDNLVLLAPAAGLARSGLVFSGLITDLDASYSLGLGGTLVKVIAQDWTADLANRFVGDTPWAVESLGSRFAKIITAAGQQTTYQVDSAPAALQVSYRDVDSASSLNLLQELAKTAGGVLWSATNLVTGPFLWLEDLNERLPLLVLEEDAGGIVRIGVADLDTLGAITLSACSVALEPVHWIQTSDDDGTRVVVQWLEQTVDEHGVPKPSQRDETVIDAAAEAATGVRRVAISTQLINAPNASDLAARLLARLRTPGWRITGLELNLNQYERLDAAGLEKVMTLLDGTTRIGCPILLTDLPEWSPVASALGGALPLYLEGARFTSSDGYWQLELLTSDGGNTGASAKWNELDPGWQWNEFDPAIAWISLTGVGVE